MKIKRFTRIVAMCLVLCLCLPLAACKNTGGTDTTAGAGDYIDYTLQVKTEGGLPLEDMNIFVYADSQLQDMVAVATTQADGTAVFSYAGTECYAVLQDVPEGYIAQESYHITEQTTQIALGVQLVEGDLTAATYKLGDVMQDFTVTDTDGVEHKLSQLLQTKKAVVLNFWYLMCDPCKAEFPYLQAAYEAYSEDVAVLAMNPYDGDNASVAQYKSELGLTFPMASVDGAWADAMRLTAYPTTVVIDRYGTVVAHHTGSITQEGMFEDIFAYFAQDEYTQTIVNDVKTLVKEDTSEDAVENPTEIGGVTEFKVTVDPGKTVYVSVYKVDGMYMSIDSANASVSYDGKTYTPTDGTVGLMVACENIYTPAYLGFGNTGTKQETFTIHFSLLPGTFNNPYTMKLEEFTASVSAGNDQGVYYTYVAQQDGTLTVQCLSATAGVKYDYYLYNLDSYAQRNLGTDGDSSGVPTVSVQVKKGQTVQFSIGSLPDDDNSYPAASFRMKAFFEAGEVADTVVKIEKTTYAVTVTDGDRKPMANVNVRFSGSKASAVIITNEKGVASVSLETGDYEATVVAPDGYFANTPKFKLTKNAPMCSVKLDPVVDNTAKYSVVVLDDTGKPLSGVLVAVLDGGFAFTDENGIAVFTLEKGSYSVMVDVPDGYSLSNNIFSFAQGTTAMSVKLSKGGTDGSQPGGELTPGTVAYTVNVTDNAGYPATDVLVWFLQDGNMVSVKSVGPNGSTTAYLPAGNYTVKLTLQGGVAAYYNEAKAKLTAAKTTLDLTVAADLREAQLHYDNFGEFYTLDTGSSYVALGKGEANYDASTRYENLFVFYPQQSGVYRFAITDGAVLRSWGMDVNPYFAGANTENGDGYFEINIDQSQVDNSMGYVLGASAGTASAATVTVSRVGDLPGELPWTAWEINGAPSKYNLTITQGREKYVDISAGSAAKAVLGSDGYYHLNSATGPILMMRMDVGTRYFSLAEMLGVTGKFGTGMKAYFYDAAGNMISREDYTERMYAYATNAAVLYTYDYNGEQTQALAYPVTEDIAYVLQTYGEYAGWYDSSSGNYLLSGSVDPELAWLFCCIYVD